MPVTFSCLAGHGQKGLSLPEVVITLTIVGILAAILIPIVSGTFSSSQHHTADANLKLLNQAVLKYNQANTNIFRVPVGTDEDELAIFQLLQTRDENVFGSPFLRAGMTVSSTSDPDTYRAVWNGRLFQMETNDSGDTGLNLLEMK